LKTPKKTAEPKDSLTFEQAIQRLEKIVADMEAAELPLEDVLKKYEEGTRLVRFCSQKLDEAEKKIELLTKKSDAPARLEPFEPEENEGDQKEAKLL
jgi:exodeoxyribonuclease VII small subunit